jgi:hypothetical protein
VGKYGSSGHATERYGACSLRAGYIRLQTHSHNLQHVLLFHGRNDSTKSPQCDVACYRQRHIEADHSLGNASLEQCFSNCGPRVLPLWSS